MQLHPIDWAIVVASIAICFIPALFFARRSGKSTSEYFASGRSVPWWLAGLSMVATTFSSDTPNLVTNFVRTQGVAGNWQWWAFVLTGVATVFFYAQLWRRSGVLTDLEFYELRYSGKAARLVRGFRAIYLGLFFNCVIMASVNLAACKIAAVLFGLDRWQTLLLVGLLNVVFAAHSGLWGVLVIDMIQFFIKMSAVIAAAYFAVRLPEVGGLSGLVEKLSTRQGPGGLNYLAMLPDFTSNKDLAVAVFIMPMAVQWWAVWYPGSEPGGGSFIAQRMLASKSEHDSLGGVLFFNLAHYVLRPWPWILVALASLIVYPQLSDIQKAFPHLDPAPDRRRHRLSRDAQILARGLDGPDGRRPDRGQFVDHPDACSTGVRRTWCTTSTSGSSGRGSDEKHYVFAGRIATVGLFFCSAAMVYLLDTAQDNFNLMLQIGAGTGLLYLVRWFWWRVNAWCEIVAMIASFGIAVFFLDLCRRTASTLGTHEELLMAVVFTTICWVAAAFLAPADRPRDPDQLLSQGPPLRPRLGADPRPGGRVVEAEAAVGGSHENMPLALLGWVSGCVVDLVGSLLPGQFSLRPKRLCIGLAVGLRCQRTGADQGDQTALDVSREQASRYRGSEWITRQKPNATLGVERKELA